MSGKYDSPGAIRAAIDARLAEQSRQYGRDPNWLRRRLAFARLLVRLVDHDPDVWVLKGGMAVELRRPGMARSTRDIDLVLRPGLVSNPADPVELHRAIVEALLDDPDGDGLVFSVAAPSRLRDDAYGRPAWRFSVDCSLAGRQFAGLKLDVVARPEEIGGVERRTLPDVLGFAGISSRSLWVVDLRQQFAEKLHALTRVYESGESTRVKDLVDLVLLVEDGVPADRALVHRVRHVFNVRRVHAMPHRLPDPPQGWGAPYSVLAAEIGLDNLSHQDAHVIVATHWRKALSSVDPT
jgi:hypothetical protein